MLDKVISIAGAIFALGLMVTIHELGHFLAARFFGVRVDVFSFGMGPRIVGFKRGDTDYRISILPIGGYVRMAGENPGDERTGAADEFMSKKRWQRAIIALAGPIMNLGFAVIITAILLMRPAQEPAYTQKPIEVSYVEPGSFAEKAGIQPGDHITEINGAQDPTWQRAYWEAGLSVPGSTIPITIERDGTTISSNVEVALDQFGSFGFPEFDTIIDSTIPGQPAARAGLHAGDEILEVNGHPVENTIQFSDLLQKNGDRVANLKVSRGGHAMPIAVRPTQSDGDGGVRWRIGAMIVNRSEMVQRNYGVVESTRLSFWINTRITQQILGVIGELFTSRRAQVLKQVLGPIGIVAASGKAAREGLHELFSVMAIISLNLGILNLLPVPILDGGHLLMLGIESTMRRDLTLRAKEIFLQVGMVFLLILFAIVIYHDIVRLMPHS
ncbi:MAG TPA: RIP metalloprotease RseP [Candidatus Acidoferrales bacterium]|nr:RIP metalloprotease RseP [Candidatus Acidoferrales bacterium]